MGVCPELITQLTYIDVFPAMELGGRSQIIGEPRYVRVTRQSSGL